MKRLGKFVREQRGASAAEFALVVPLFTFFIIGIAQLGILYFANAGLNNAIAEGARRVTLYPRPDDAAIKSKIDAGRFGLEPAKLTVEPIVYGQSNSSDFADLSMQYRVKLNFIFVDVPEITLKKSRRVYLQPPLPTGR